LRTLTGRVRTSVAQRLQFDQWQEEYRKKMVTAEEAARVVKSGDRGLN
jgi:hypothetical protein